MAQHKEVALVEDVCTNCGEQIKIDDFYLTDDDCPGDSICLNCQDNELREYWAHHCSSKYHHNFI